MQEEVNEKTVALIIHSSKVTAEVLKATLVKVIYSSLGVEPAVTHEDLHPVYKQAIEQLRVRGQA